MAGAILWFLYLTYSQQVNDIFPKGFRKALKRDYYIIAAYSLFPILFFFACSRQLAYEEKKEWERITDEDREQVINTLSLYQLPEDYLYIQSELAKILEDNEISPEEDLDFFYLNNILHIDSVISQSIELAKQNKAKELVHLLEKERGIFMPILITPSTMKSTSLAYSLCYIAKQKKMKWDTIQNSSPY